MAFLGERWYLQGRTVVWIPAGDGERERFPFLAGAEQQKKW